jgi:preprotein translocase subunit SecG
MFQGLADRLKSEATFSLRGITIAAIAGVVATVAFGFLVAALFLRVADFYGPVGACLACAGLFIVIALILFVINSAASARHRRAEAARRAAAAAATPSPLADPRLIMVGVQVAQAIGFKRLLPLVALGGAAFLFASRGRRERGGVDAGRS